MFVQKNAFPHCDGLMCTKAYQLLQRGDQFNNQKTKNRISLSLYLLNVDLSRYTLNVNPSPTFENDFLALNVTV